MSADVETSQGNSGSAGNGLPSQSTESVEEKKSETHSRKFVEGPLPVVSSSNERMTHGNVPSDHVGGGVMGDGTATVKDNVITTSLEKEVSGDVMKPPSLPPPSRLKEVTTFMPPPPSLPPRFGKCKLCIILLLYRISIFLRVPQFKHILILPQFKRILILCAYMYFPL